MKHFALYAQAIDKGYEIALTKGSTYFAIYKIMD